MKQSGIDTAAKEEGLSGHGHVRFASNKPGGWYATVAMAVKRQAEHRRGDASAQKQLNRLLRMLHVKM